MRHIIAAMGEGSRIAQDLGAVLTDWARMTTTTQRLYISAAQHPDGTGCEVFGILKTGEKKLFLRDEACAMKEYQPVCVLDFYVNEGRQRMGIGLKLFQAFLSSERVDPRNLAYDRPSPKLKGFLARHFNLTHAISQSNNFLVFREFFTGADTSGAGPIHDASSQKRTMSTWERPLTAQKKKHGHHHHHHHHHRATQAQEQHMPPAPSASIPVAHIQVDAAPWAMPSSAAPPGASAAPWGIAEPSYSQALRGPSNGGAGPPLPGGPAGAPTLTLMPSLPPLRSRSGTGAGFGTPGGGGGSTGGGGSGQSESGPGGPSDGAGYAGYAAMNGHANGFAAPGVGYASIRNPSPQRQLEEGGSERERAWLNRSPSLQPLPPLSGTLGWSGSPGAAQQASFSAASPVAGQPRNGTDASSAMAAAHPVPGRLRSFGQHAVGLGLQGASPRAGPPQRLGSLKGDATPKGDVTAAGRGVGIMGAAGTSRGTPLGSSVRRPEGLGGTPVSNVPPSHFQQMPPLQWARR
eukprot:jgi/Mesvir1/12938/Mv05953-RA.2